MDIKEKFRMLSDRFCEINVRAAKAGLTKPTEGARETGKRALAGLMAASSTISKFGHAAEMPGTSQAFNEIFDSLDKDITKYETEVTLQIASL